MSAQGNKNVYLLLIRSAVGRFLTTRKKKLNPLRQGAKNQIVDTQSYGVRNFEMRNFIYTATIICLENSKGFSREKDLHHIMK